MFAMQFLTVAALALPAMGSPAFPDDANPPHGYSDRHRSPGWAGVNSYFLHAFQTPDRTVVLDAVRAAGLRTVRIFISETFQNNKGTGSVYMPDVEPKAVGTYDDTQLEAIDQLMVDAHARGIKLVIAMHDRYQLGCWGNDTYTAKYNLPKIDCSYAKASTNDVTSWYSDSAPIKDFDNRILHILEHRNKKVRGNPKWKDLSSHIFAFNIQNEGQGHLNGNIAPVPQWWCNRAKVMRRIMGRSKVLISTGGGNEFPNSDIPENWYCKSLDINSVHSYSGVEGFKKDGPIALQHALQAKKLLIFEEFGATGEDKAEIIRQHIEVFNDLKVPWMPWQISKPGNIARDYEFWTDEDTYDVVASGAKKAAKVKAAQTWPRWQTLITGSS